MPVHDIFTGTLSEIKPSKKWVPGKAILIVFLLCIFLTALAFVASALWYVYRRDKNPVQWASPSSDRLTSCSSATNLMSHGGSSFQIYKGYYDTPVKPFIGTILVSFFFFKIQNYSRHFLIVSCLKDAFQRRLSYSVEQQEHYMEQ